MMEKVKEDKRTSKKKLLLYSGIILNLTKKKFDRSKKFRELLEPQIFSCMFPNLDIADSFFSRFFILYGG